MKNKLQSVFIRLCLFVVVLSPISWQKKTEREIYELKVYHYKTDAQEKMLDHYFQNALLPALHRMKIKDVGVFKAWSNDTASDQLMYVFMPLKSLNDLTALPDKLQNDQQYMNDAKDYLDADYKNPAYTRTETIVLRAFPLAPQMHLPNLKSAKKDRVYELRSYESATEEKFRNKVQMFNEGGEIDIFKRLNFNPVFYSEALAGSKMPNLMYMTSFENKNDREEHWKSFGNDPAWKKLSALPEYQNNVSHIDMTFLYPTNYSDF